jgi:acetylornithine deacetylase/succinyl-diaminopimelate desuccinylase-like protein
MRILPWQTKQLLKKIIFDALTWYDIEIKDILYVPAVCIDKDDEIVNILQNTTNEVLGYTPWVKISWPWCDSHFFIERGIPAISWFWPEWENMHGYNEYVYIDSVIDMVKIYVLSVLNYFYN